MMRTGITLKMTNHKISMEGTVEQVIKNRSNTEVLCLQYILSSKILSILSVKYIVIDRKDFEKHLILFKKRNDRSFRTGEY